MVEKSFARALLERFYKGAQGANGFMREAIAIAVVEEELGKRLSPERHQTFVEWARKRPNRLTLLYRKLARVSTFEEMGTLHGRIESTFQRYVIELQQSQKTPG